MTDDRSLLSSWNSVIGHPTVFGLPVYYEDRRNGRSTHPTPSRRHLTHVLSERRGRRRFQGECRAASLEESGPGTRLFGVPAEPST